MELYPILYHLFVRPKWFPKSYTLYINNVIKSKFDFHNKMVLDFGSGIGTSCSMFNPANYLGVDCDSNRIRYVKRLYPEYSLVSYKESVYLY